MNKMFNFTDLLKIDDSPIVCASVYIWFVDTLLDIMFEHAINRLRTVCKR